MSVDEANEILDEHEWNGIEGLWSNYPDLTFDELRALFETACKVLGV